jgi:hypothetical protein
VLVGCQHTGRAGQACLFTSHGARGGGGDFRLRERMDSSPRPSTKLDILVIRLTETRLLQNCGEQIRLYGNSTGPVLHRHFPDTPLPMTGTVPYRARDWT